MTRLLPVITAVTGSGPDVHSRRRPASSPAAYGPTRERSGPGRARAAAAESKDRLRSRAVQMDWSSPRNPIRSCRWAARCSTALRIPPSLSLRIVSTPRSGCGRSTHTTGTDRAADPERLRRGGADRHHHQPGHPLGDEGVDQLRLALLGLLGRRADQQVLAQPRLALDPRREVRVERVREVRGDQADAVGAPRAEHRRAGMSLEAELLDDLPHPHGSGRADPRLAVDDPRDGLDRHLGAAGHVRHGRAARAVLRGQVGAPVRQRWHSPSLSGAERASSTTWRGESRLARTRSGSVSGSRPGRPMLDARAGDGVQWSALSDNDVGWSSAAAQPRSRAWGSLRPRDRSEAANSSRNRRPVGQNHRAHWAPARLPRCRDSQAARSLSPTAVSLGHEEVMTVR